MIALTFTLTISLVGFKDLGSSAQEIKIITSEQGLALTSFAHLISWHLVKQNSALYIVVYIFPLNIRIFFSDLSLFFRIVPGLLSLTT